MEIIECNERGIFGPNLEVLRKEFTDEEVIRFTGNLLLVLDCYVVPEVGRRMLNSMKEVTHFREMVTAVTPLAELFEVSENPDIFRDTVPQEQRDRIVQYVREHWHPVVET